MIGCTTADVEDVVTYYVMFFTKPVGTYVLQVCRTLSCALNGAERVTDEICKHLHVRPGETDAPAPSPCRSSSASARAIARRSS